MSQELMLVRFQDASVIAEVVCPSRDGNDDLISGGARIGADHVQMPPVLVLKGTRGYQKRSGGGDQLNGSLRT